MERPETPAAPSAQSGARASRVPCALCHKELPPRQMVTAAGLRPSLADHVAARHPDAWSPDARICAGCMRAERISLLMRTLEQERGELSAVEAEIALKAAEHLTLAANIEAEFERRATFGQRLADRVAAIGGSWPFVSVFFALLLAWAVLNTFLLRGRAFDPYPYILLNLVLSCLAAVQAPIIMMSQNRVAARDRMQADQDFKTNLKAEIEIASLHEKVDHLLHAQWQRMVEIQQAQIDILNEIAEARRRR
jgi:uncharacterized membrane protein